ncbi:uncharacterized protein LOC131938927 [Physella acuta]|uniref:uncharacterized protein LOC131938927 n=1 Tax=Physella acuta TaxID=109671 RepID=UPI0027DE5417|nr:uncharacterized protein LOC131938927 [Physella acuta]XP_059153145.1 uncharacterized protein LOC131938927 [Physella acuta]
MTLHHVTTCALLIGLAVSAVPNLCPQLSAINPKPATLLYSNPESCGSYFVCVHGNAILMPCPQGTHFNEKYSTCVKQGSLLDTCTSKIDVCSGGATLVPHPQACQRYFNCSDNSSRDGSPLKPYEDECPYPQLFDVGEKRCKPYNTAICGASRVPAKDPCGYLKNHCSGIYCEACISRFPSCVGHRNGIYVHPLKKWTPYYIRCTNERTEVLQCDSHPSGSRGFFSPLKKECVSIWEVSPDLGLGYGLAPTCTGKLPGQYRTEENAVVYYTCPGAEVFYCTNGTVFNEVTAQCEAVPSFENLPPDVCSGGADLVPHPRACHQFYNCSDTSSRDNSLLEPHQDECPYPQLFDVVEKRCKPYSATHCGASRKNVKDPCEYLKNHCVGTYCNPCPVNYPSCVGLSDGIYAHPLKQWSPYYIRCTFQRTEVLQCDVHPSGSRGFFSPLKKECVSIWEVSPDLGLGYGLAPTCTGKLPGQYRTDENAVVYYTCPGAEVFYCTNGTVFSEVAGKCEAEVNKNINQ